MLDIGRITWSYIWFPFKGRCTALSVHHQNKELLVFLIFSWFFFLWMQFMVPHAESCMLAVSSTSSLWRARDFVSYKEVLQFWPDCKSLTVGQHYLNSNSVAVSVALSVWQLLSAVKSFISLVLDNLFVVYCDFFSMLVNLCALEMDWFAF
jgi:hypothetical protein